MIELLKPWANNSRTTRVVCANSYFASVQSLRELRQSGFLFIGVVKTATKQFPMAHLTQQMLPQQGDLYSLVSKDENGNQEMLETISKQPKRTHPKGGGPRPTGRYIDNLNVP